MTQILYKYRTLTDFQRFMDIIVNKRLYAAHYKDLNDPMEGQYYYKDGILNNSIREKLYTDKNQLKILSLSKEKNNLLMWSHYSDGERGIAIGVKINDNIYDVTDVLYDGLHEVDRENYINLSARGILSHKLSVWNYEKEVRVFVENEKFINVDIHEIILGSRIDHNLENLLRQIVREIDPNIRLIKRTRN